jgi:hypothetical protein
MQIELIELASRGSLAETEVTPVVDDPFLFFRGLWIALLLSLPIWAAAIWGVLAVVSNNGSSVAATTP